MLIRGVGIASVGFGLGYGSARPDFGSAELEMFSDGTVTIWCGASELGQGLRTILCQLAAEELGIAYEDVSIISSDTAKTPDAGPVSASRSTYVQGNAVLKAAQDLKQELVALACLLLDACPERIAFYKGSVQVEDTPKKTMAIRALAEQMHALGRRTRWVGRYEITTADVDPYTSQGDAYAGYAWVSQLAVVEVNTDTGQVTLLQLASATDTGKAINPKAVEGQIEGGVLQGLGFALMEEIKMDAGYFVNADLSTYIIPSAADMPRIDSLIVEVPDKKGPYGAKGVGEPVTIPTTPAIFNAIASTTEQRLFKTPVNPETLLSIFNDVRTFGKKVAPDMERMDYPAI